MFKIIILIFLFYSLTGCKTMPLNKKNNLSFFTPSKPKIGLFISGAGANTFSAISLLQLLQQENIFFDSYGGTGWGAVVAALYAKNKNVNELKWNIFKLKEQGIFKNSWFKKKVKHLQLLKFLKKEIFPSPLNTSFICPALNNKGQIIWMTNTNISLSLLNCIHNLPPLSLHFEEATKSGSLFSADLVIKNMQKQKIDTLIWIKPALSLKVINFNKKFLIFFKELIAYTEHIKQLAIKNNSKIIIFETKSDSSFSVNDFSKLNAIIKTPPLLKEREQIYRLKNKLKKNTSKQYEF